MTKQLPNQGWGAGTFFHRLSAPYKKDLPVPAPTPYFLRGFTCSGSGSFSLYIYLPALAPAHYIFYWLSLPLKLPCSQLRLPNTFPNIGQIWINIFRNIYMYIVEKLLYCTCSSMILVPFDIYHFIFRMRSIRNKKIFLWILISVFMNNNTFE